MARFVVIAVLLATVAVAADRLTLTLADGTKKSVTLKSFDETGLDVTQNGRELRFAWADLKPASAYAARKALTSYDDGAARLELAAFAVRLKLYPEGLEQLEIALALGGIDEQAFERRTGEIAEEEVAHLSASIDTLLLAKAPPAVSLAAIKRLKDRYPDHEANAKYAPHIKELVEQLASKAEAEQDAQEKAVSDEALERLQKLLDKEIRKKVAAIEKGDALVKEADPAIKLRQVSRVKKKLVEPMGAEKYYKKARKHLRSLAQKDKHGLVVSKAELQKEYEQLQHKLVDCYLKVARIFISQRNYKGAVKYVRKILLYDPIHEEALEMVDVIRKNRITFRISDVTNARPRVSGG
jgi:tetratricopeptide (TPR) repeat protein